MGSANLLRSVEYLIQCCAKVQGRSLWMYVAFHSKLLGETIYKSPRNHSGGPGPGEQRVNENSKFQVRPLYLQVRDALFERIKKGSWKPGGSLPSELDLYRDLGVSLGTLRKALEVLESEKLIVRRPGRGTFVEAPPPRGLRQVGRKRLVTTTSAKGEAGPGRMKAGSQSALDGDAFQVRPLYLQVRDALVQRIKDGRWKPGGNIPSEIDLYRELGVSLGTLRKALGVLESEKLIVRRPGRGTFIRDHATARTPGHFNPIRAADGTAVRGEVRNREVKVESANATERAMLKLAAGDRIARIQQVRFSEQRPFTYELHHLPDRRFPGLATRTALPDDLEEIAKIWGVVPSRAEAKVRVTPATPVAAAALSLANRQPVLTMERLVFDSEGEPIWATTAFYDLHDEYCWLEIR